MFGNMKSPTPLKNMNGEAANIHHFCSNSICNNSLLRAFSAAASFIYFFVCFFLHHPVVAGDAGLVSIFLSPALGYSTVA
jgi:hypothetical protein